MTPIRFRKLAPAASALFAASLLCLALASTASAAEKLYWQNYDSESIAFSGIDGNGGGALNIGSAQDIGMKGLAIDSATGRAFWSSTDSGESGKIFSANLDNSGGGERFNTGSAPVDEPYGVVIDPITRTIYWANYGTGESEGSIGYAQLDGGSSGQLDDHRG